MSDLLEIYLRDHHAGMTATLELAQRSLHSNRDSDYGPELADTVREVEEDRESLERVMEALGIRHSAVKDAGVRIAERIGRLKPNGRLLQYSPLSRVLELEGIAIGLGATAALWETLSDIDDDRLDGIEMTALLGRATEQRGRLERMRASAAKQAFATPAETPAPSPSPTPTGG